MKFKFFSLMIFVFGYINNNLWAQIWPADTITVNINSGDPQFPFPQFKEYFSGKSLAKYNAEGVTHADMEKAMREGYQIMMHRALKVPGKSLGGIPYIVYNYHSVPRNYGTFVSEGDGYAMLAAAYFADKKTFDGLWLWIHDNRLSGVKKYYDCSNLRPSYTFGAGFAGWQSTEADPITSTSINSAADGDVDIAMALLMAHKQWGDNMGINDGCGTPISYKKAALDMIKVMVDTLFYTTSPSGVQAGTKGYLTGIVGIDGYMKSGNTWGEVTNWRSSAVNTIYPWAKAVPDPIQVKSKYVDYIAPAYFNEFAKFLAENGGTQWQINQYKRAEASSDWTIGQMFAKGFIASAGDYKFVADDGSNITFGSFAAGEDFRTSWRTILNNVWHGNPDSTWNPVTHQRISGGNTYEYDMAIRHADFLKYPRVLPSANTSAVCSVLGASPDLSCPNYKGVSQIKRQYSSTGSVIDNYNANWMYGTGMPAAVASGDIDLTAELYRQCEIMWDDQSGSGKMTKASDRYITSTPKYFDDWFRLLGMLTASGNLQAPTEMKPSANIKVYLAVDKTFAYAGDQITYYISYRNFGSIAATGVTITVPFDGKYDLIAATNGGKLVGNILTFNIGSVPGFKTGTGIANASGVVSFTVKVKPIATNSRSCLLANIKANNSDSWSSNEYPNNATYTMERNCVDLLASKPISIIKSASKSNLNVGDEVTIKVSFGNKANKQSLLNGGRDRVVVSYANFYPSQSASFYQFFRLWHTAPEAYLNIGNYRVSYFMNDSLVVGGYNSINNTTGWNSNVDNQMDLDKYLYNPSSLPTNEQINFSYQKVAKGSDTFGKYNQKLTVQFANVLTAPSSHIYGNLDSEYLIHKGVTGPSLIRTRLEPKVFANLSSRILDDWSYSSTVSNTNLDGYASRFFPVSPTYTNHSDNNAAKGVNNFSKDVCSADVTNFGKVLVEEYDGYTWRRIAGNAPVYGAEAKYVSMTDTIPKYFSWAGFVQNKALSVQATYYPAPASEPYTGVVVWSVPEIALGDSSFLTYKVITKDPGCIGSNSNVSNKAWITSDLTSWISSSLNMSINCVVTDINSTSVNNNILLYPNPTHENTTLDLTQYNEKVNSLSIKTLRGNLVYSTSKFKQINDLPTNSLASGVYIVEVLTEKGTIIQKLTVVK